MTRGIGGFLPLRIGRDTAVRQSVLDAWIPPGRDALCLHNARSALSALWQAAPPPRIWLPAYVCPEVAACVPEQCSVRYFGLDEQLQPRLETLTIAQGDHVLAVDYFGRPPGAQLLAFVSAHPGTCWIEDRAQALSPGPEWADWILYSPRKVLGVPDGGILVAGRSPLPVWAREWQPPRDLGFMLPCLERLEDVEELRNEEWYSHYRRVEDAMAVGSVAMSRVTAAVLASADIGSDRERRIANFAILRDRLAQWAFLDEGALSFAPLGFPLQLPAAADLARRLAARRIFAARHWPSLPSDPALFPAEHRLSRELLTLPCDYRYDAREMRFVADTVVSELAA